MLCSGGKFTVVLVGRADLHRETVTTTIQQWKETKLKFCCQGQTLFFWQKCVDFMQLEGLIQEVMEMEIGLSR